MSLYVLDTSILVGWLRGAAYAQHVKEESAIADAPNIAFISVVSAGEMQSLAIQLGWGQGKKDRLDALLHELPWIDISAPSVLHAYAQIDAYSQGKLPGRELPPGVTSRNMGKNDLWIAATTAMLGAICVTTDRDFDHLDGAFLSVVRVDPTMRLP